MNTEWTEEIHRYCTTTVYLPELPSQSRWAPRTQEPDLSHSPLPPYLQSVAGLTGVCLGVGEGANFINRRTSQCLLQEYCCNISLPFRFQVSFKVKDATFLGHVVPTKTLNTLNDNIIPTQSFLLSLYMLTNKGYFLILFAPNNTALEENQAENPIFKNKLFTFWVIHGLCYTR